MAEIPLERLEVWIKKNNNKIIGSAKPYRIRLEDFYNRCKEPQYSDWMRFQDEISRCISLDNEILSDAWNYMFNTNPTILYVKQKTTALSSRLRH